MVLKDYNIEDILGVDGLRRHLRREDQANEIRRQKIAERQNLTVSDSDEADSDDDGPIAVRGIESL